MYGSGGGELLQDRALEGELGGGGGEQDVLCGRLPPHGLRTGGDGIGGRGGKGEQGIFMRDEPIGRRWWERLTPDDLAIRTQSLGAIHSAILQGTAGPDGAVLGLRCGQRDRSHILRRLS